MTAELAASEPGSKHKTSQFVGFQLAQQDYLFRIEQIREVVILKQVTKTPQVPSYVEGVANLRGSIIPIINLRKLFGLEPKPADEDTRIIVVHVANRNMGCTVDTVSQVLRIPDENIRPAPDTISSGAVRYVSGFAKHNDRLMIVLDIDELLDPDKLQQVHAIASQAAARATSIPTSTQGKPSS